MTFPNLMYFGTIPCRVVDLWSQDGISYILGQSNINAKYYALVNDRYYEIMEFEDQPERSLVMEIWQQAENFMAS